MTTAPPDSPVERRNWLDRLLRLAGDVEAGESTTAILLSANVFLLLTAYYIIRPVREGLILTESGAVVRSYAGAILAVAFIFIVPAYGKFASKANRIRLINGVMLFFVSNLVIFYFLGSADVPIGVPFFLWVSIFNLMVIAQFWSFANDVYTEAQGKRLFAIVGFGQSVGAVLGSAISVFLFGEETGLFVRLLVAGGFLLGCLALTNIVHVREKRRVHVAEERQQIEEPLTGEGGFQLVMRHRYLLLIGLMTLIIQFVNTNGEYILAETFTAAATEELSTGTGGVTEEEIETATGEIIASFYASFNLVVNLLALLIQFFLVSRIFKYIGISQALFIMPLISLCSYGLMAAVPILAYIRIAKISENATDYSLQNTTRRALFLRTSRAAKYKALQAVETFFWRGGDAFSGLAVFAVVGLLGLGVRPFAAINIALVVVWLLIARGINRKYKTGETETAGNSITSM